MSPIFWFQHWPYAPGAPTAADGLHACRTFLFRAGARRRASNRLLCVRRERNLDAVHGYLRRGALTAASGPSAYPEDSEADVASPAALICAFYCELQLDLSFLHV